MYFDLLTKLYLLCCFKKIIIFVKKVEIKSGRSPENVEVMRSRFLHDNKILNLLGYVYNFFRKSLFYEKTVKSSKYLFSLPNNHLFCSFLL